VHARAAANPGCSLRQQIASRAEFIRVWTQSDESIRVNDVFDDRALAIARNYGTGRCSLPPSHAHLSALGQRALSFDHRNG